MSAAIFLFLMMVALFAGIYAALVEICGSLLAWVIALALSVAVYTKIIARR